MSPETELEEIARELQLLQADAALQVENNFTIRAAAMEYMDIHILERLGILPQHGRSAMRLTLEAAAAAHYHALEQTDRRLWNQLRARISTDACRTTCFRDLVAEFTGYDSRSAVKPEAPGYDILDLFINGLFSAAAMPEPTVSLSSDSIEYQKTPARILFQLADMAGACGDDVFIDLGAGLGQPAMLFHLLTGIPSIGIEIEPAYCAYARNSAAHLSLPLVSFIEGDVRQCNLGEGSIFFLYTPFRDAMLDDVLHLLESRAHSRRISLFSYGPCSVQMSKQHWLECKNGPPSDPHFLYYFRSTP